MAGRLVATLLGMDSDWTFFRSLSIMNTTPGQSADEEILKRWHDDPSNWKFGIFYYNKEDKRIFPPKRIRGIGWTVNFANPLSLLALAGLLTAIVTIITYLG
ncbi:MAG: DUF5808 domain-containing protein [Bacteroidota bacterium]|jgi:uncharacterized membrane protein